MIGPRTVCHLSLLVTLILVGILPGQGVLLPPIRVSTLLEPRADEKPNPLTKGKATEPDREKSDIGGEPLPPPPKLGETLTPGTGIGTASSATPVRLADVLVSIDRHFPQIRAAEQERVVADGRRLSAQGPYDVNFRSEERFQDGTYDSQRYSAYFEQLTPFHGMSFFGGYRLGSGDYPVYYGDRKTADGGEFRAGAVLPLARDRAIDKQRADLAKTNIDRSLAEPNIHQTRLDTARAATRAYWSWVAAGQRLLITREVLRIAQDRDAQLGKRVAIGNLPRIERDDNRRAIVERQARLVFAERLFQQSAIALSLYLRDASGCLVVPPLTSLPNFLTPEPPPDPSTRQKALEQAMARRPEVARLALQREKIMVDLDLARNQTLPAVNLAVIGSQDVGFGKRSPSSTSRLDRQSVEMALLVNVPLQRSDARGRILAAQGELARLNAQLQFATDRVQVEVQDALNAMDRAYELLSRGQDNRLQASYLERAERRQFDVGKSDLFRVNLRELAAAEARVLEVDAAAEFYRSLADYLAALGFDPSAPPNASPTANDSKPAVSGSTTPGALPPTRSPTPTSDLLPPPRLVPDR